MILGILPAFFQNSKVLKHSIVCNKQVDNRFSAMGSPNTVWAISSIHADIERLTNIHNAVFERITPGDRLLYLGNYTGFGNYSRETIDELLTFRRLVLAQPGMKPDDLIYLRGAQEDMWQRLMQLHFDNSPVDSLLWMMGNGMGATMQSYGIDAHDGITAAKEGTISLTRWTNHIRYILRQNAGHDCFMTNNRRAAYTNHEDRYPLLFVNAGLDPQRSLEDQDDNLCWAFEEFENMTDSYAPFEKVVRGFDPNHQGVMLNCITATLDGGCGFGGSLVCAGMSSEGEIFELMEA